MQVKAGAKCQGFCFAKLNCLSSQRLMSWAPKSLIDEWQTEAASKLLDVVYVSCPRPNWPDKCHKFCEQASQSVLTRNRDLDEALGRAKWPPKDGGAELVLSLLCRERTTFQEDSPQRPFWRSRVACHFGRSRATPRRFAGCVCGFSAGSAWLRRMAGSWAGEDDTQVDGDP